MLRTASNPLFNRRAIIVKRLYTALWLYYSHRAFRPRLKRAEGGWRVSWSIN